MLAKAAVVVVGPGVDGGALLAGDEDCDDLVGLVVGDVEGDVCHGLVVERRHLCGDLEESGTLVEGLLQGHGLGGGARAVESTALVDGLLGCLVDGAYVYLERLSGLAPHLELTGAGVALEESDPGEEFGVGIVEGLRDVHVDHAVVSGGADEDAPLAGELVAEDIAQGRAVVRAHLGAEAHVDDGRKLK